MDPLETLEPKKNQSDGMTGLDSGSKLFPTDLSLLDAEIAWEILARELTLAVGPKRHAFHLFSVATVKEDGSPDSRTVVLRKFCPKERQIWFHTDSRSGKFLDLKKNPKVLLHWYDPASRCQLRMKALATLHHRDEKARLHWESSLPMSRACYTTPLAPGMIIEDDFPPAPPAPARGDDRGFANFVAVCCRFHEIDWLYLRAQGHQRVNLKLDEPMVTWKKIAP